MKKQRGKMWEESLYVHLKQLSNLSQEKFVPHARLRITQSQTSPLQPSLAKPFAVIRSKVVPSLCWSGVVTKMAYGRSKTDMSAISCRQLFTTITKVQEQNKETFVRSASPDSDILCRWVQTIHRYTKY